MRFVGLNELAGLQLPDVYRTAIESWIDRMDADESRGPSQAETDAAGPCLAELCLAMELADIADGLALQLFRGSEVAVQTKPDGSPVTEADLAIENAMRARLAVARPDHGIVGEEAGSSGNARSRWYVDPIDGTSRFLIGDPQWYTFIALADGDTVTVSVISAPALGLRWWALRDAGAFCNGRPMAVSRTRTLAEAVVNDDWRGTLRQGILDRPLSKIARRCNRFRPYEGHSYLAIADGHGDIAAGAGGGPWDYAAVKLIGRVFAAWRAYQHKHQNRDRLQAEIAPIHSELRQLLEDASPKSKRTRWHRRFANNLLKVWPALWTFVTVEGVEPTNNPAERALRAAVIHRKVSLGTQSENGERFTERALSAAAACRLQDRSLFTYLSDLIGAHNRGDPFPALA